MLYDTRDPALDKGSIYGLCGVGSAMNEGEKSCSYGRPSSYRPAYPRPTYKNEAEKINVYMAGVVSTI